MLYHERNIHQNHRFNKQYDAPGKHEFGLRLSGPVGLSQQQVVRQPHHKLIKNLQLIIYFDFMGLHLTQIYDGH